MTRRRSFALAAVILSFAAGYLLGMMRRERERQMFAELLRRSE